MTEKRNKFKKIRAVVNHWLFGINRENGQSLMEVVIALAIGAILIGGASTAIVVVLQSSKTSQIQQSATALGREIVEEARIYGMADWSSLYSLEKGSSTKYFFNASDAELSPVKGIEGVVDGDIRDGLVGHWKLDEATSTTAYDYSGNGNDGSTSGAMATSTDSCLIGRCYIFDGVDDYIEIANDPSLQVVGDGTWSLWIYPTNFDAGRQGLIFKDYNREYEVIMEPDGKISFYHGDGTWEEIQEPPGMVVSENEWNYVAITRDIDSKIIKFYLNGKFIGEDSFEDTPVSSSNAVDIGRRKGSDYNFQGKIDEVRIYNRTLSSDEIEHLYNSTAFNRYFYVENVCRTNDADYGLGGAAPCDSGEVEDPSTQLVTGVVEWAGEEEKSRFSLSEYVTRWQNEVFHQTDWSGGSGQEGPVSGFTDKYASSTGVNVSNLGEIRIEGL